MATIRFSALKAVLCSAALLVAGATSAAVVERVDFAGATNIGFGLAPVGASTIAPTGFSSIVGGVVVNLPTPFAAGGASLTGNIYQAAERDNPSTPGVDLGYWGIRLNFSSAVSAVGFDVGGNIGNRFVLSIFDSSDNLLERLVRGSNAMDLVDPLDPDSAVVDFLGLSQNTNNIAYATIASLVGLPGSPSSSPSDPRDGFAIDNVVFNQVPEPATALLMGAGLLGWAVARKRWQTA